MEKKKKYSFKYRRKNDWKFVINSKNELYQKFLKEKIIENPIVKAYIPIKKAIFRLFKSFRIKKKNENKKIIPYIYIKHLIEYRSLNKTKSKIIFKNNLRSTRKSKKILKFIKGHLAYAIFPRIENNKEYPLILIKERQKFFKYIIELPLFKYYLFFYKKDNSIEIKKYLKHPFSKNKFKMIILKIKFPLIFVYVNNPYSKKYFEVNLLDPNSIFSFPIGDIYI